MESAREEKHAGLLSLPQKTKPVQHVCGTETATGMQRGNGGMPGNGGGGSRCRGDNDGGGETYLTSVTTRPAGGAILYTGNNVKPTSVVALFGFTRAALHGGMHTLSSCQMDRAKTPLGPFLLVRMTFVAILSMIPLAYLAVRRELCAECSSSS